MSKRITLTAALLALVMLLTLAGCKTDTEPAGAEAEITAQEEPVAGIVRGKVTDDNSNMLIAGIIVEDEEGSIDRQCTNAYGGYNLLLAPGKYTLTFTKGSEFNTATKEVVVESLKTYYLPDVRLTQLYDSYARGWIAGDCHQHSYYSDGVDSIQSLMISNASVGLYWGFLTDHNNSRGVPEWVGEVSVNVLTDRDGNSRRFFGFDGVEVTAEYGHYNSLGSGLTLETYDLTLREAERSSADKAAIIRSDIAYIVDSIKRVGGLAQMNHPYSTTTMGAMNWIEPDDYELLDEFDTIEIWNGYFVPPDGIYTQTIATNQNYTSKLLWYSLLNAMKEGHPFHAATGGTDNHDSENEVSAKNHNTTLGEIDSLESYYNLIKYAGKYSGNPTTYIRSDGELTMDSVKRAVAEGHSFISNGPVVICDIEGAGYGDVLKPTGDKLTVNTEVFNRDGITEIRVVVNGEIVAFVNPESGCSSYSEPIAIEKAWEKNDWIVIEVLGPVSQFAITNPIIIG